MKFPLCICVCALMVTLCNAAQYLPMFIAGIQPLTDSTILITDAGSAGGVVAVGGVYEINRNGNILWSFAGQTAWAHSAERMPDGRTLITDTGQDRVIIVDSLGTIVWSSDSITLSDGSHLRYPNDAHLVASSHLLITDRDNHRAVEIALDGTIVWQFGVTGVLGLDSTHINAPHNADRLANGNTIICDSENNRIVEVNPAGAIVWTYAQTLGWPRDADRLANGNTLIASTFTNEIREVNSAGATVRSLSLSAEPYEADCVSGGQIFVSTAATVYEYDSSGVVVWQYPLVQYTTQQIMGRLITAPNGCSLFVKIIQPDTSLYPGAQFPAVVYVPENLEPAGNKSLNIARLGYVEIYFNAQGRGVVNVSQGVENYNGFVHQEDLKTVIEYTHAMENVVQDNIGVLSLGFGTVMAAGCLGRFPELPVKFLVDVEGPSNSNTAVPMPWSYDADPANDTLIDQTINLLQHQPLALDSSDTNQAFWAQREPIRFIGLMDCYYLRVQSEYDRILPDWYANMHAIDLINSAVQGLCPWVNVNGSTLSNIPGSVYDSLNAPVWYTGSMAAWPSTPAECVIEMFNMPPLEDTRIHEPRRMKNTPVADISVWPNPFNPVVKIVLSEPVVCAMVDIFTVSGATVYRTRDFSGASFEWNAAGFPCGVYCVRISSGKKTLSAKLVLRK